MPASRRLLAALVFALVAIAGCASALRPAAMSRSPASSKPAVSAPHQPAHQPAHKPTPSASRAKESGMALPLRTTTGTARQLVTVVAPSSRSTTATLQAWSKSARGWHRVGPATAAQVGSAGLTRHPSEGMSATPIGSFTLTQAFGNAADPGTRLSYFRTDESDWWVSDTSSRHYNTHYRCSGSCPFDTSAGENLRSAGHVYTYAVVIDYNRFPVTRGAGSAFFLHVTDGRATAGCVSIPEARLVSIMKWLDPAAHPRIVIGVT